MEILIRQSIGNNNNNNYKGDPEDDSEESKKWMIPVPANEKVFPCEHCDYKSAKISNLKRHIVSMHNADKEIKTTATTPSSLPPTSSPFFPPLPPDPLPESAKENLYPCEHCDYKSKTNFNLKRHIESIHKAYKQIKTPAPSPATPTSTPPAASYPFSPPLPPAPLPVSSNEKF